MKAQKWSLAAVVSAGVAAMVASACCVGPLVLALMGLGGAGLLVKFEPYRPIFMGATLALLAAGFVLSYRKPAAATARAGSVECDCPAPRASRAGRVALWVAAAVIGALLVFPYLTPILFE